MRYLGFEEAKSISKVNLHTFSGTTTVMKKNLWKLGNEIWLPSVTLLLSGSSQEIFDTKYESWNILGSKAQIADLNALMAFWIIAL